MNFVQIILSLILLANSVILITGIPIKKTNDELKKVSATSRDFKGNGRQLFEPLFANIFSNLITALTPSIQGALQQAVSNISLADFFREEKSQGLDTTGYESFLVNIPKIGSFVIVINKQEKPDVSKPSYSIKPIIQLDTHVKPSGYLNTHVPHPTTTPAPPSYVPNYTEKPFYVPHPTSPPPSYTEKPSYTTAGSYATIPQPTTYKHPDEQSKIHSHFQHPLPSIAEFHNELKLKTEKLISDTIEKFLKHSTKYEHLFTPEKPSGLEILHPTWNSLPAPSISPLNPYPYHHQYTAVQPEPILIPFPSIVKQVDDDFRIEENGPTTEDKDKLKSDDQPGAGKEFIEENNDDGVNEVETE